MDGRRIDDDCVLVCSWQRYKPGEVVFDTHGERAFSVSHACISCCGAIFGHSIKQGFEYWVHPLRSSQQVSNGAQGGRCKVALACILLCPGLHLGKHTKQ